MKKEPENEEDFLLGINYIDEPIEDLGALVDGRYNLGHGNWQHKKHKLWEDEI